MILKRFNQDWKTVGEHALFFAEIWLIIGTAFGLVNQSFPLPWLAMVTIATLGCAVCMAFLWVVAIVIGRIQGKDKKFHGE